jgi:hypothetical protein
MEDKKVDYGTRDVGISNIKYRTKEVTIATYQETQKVGGTLPLEKG